VASDTTVPSSKPAVQPFSPTTEYSDNSNSLANFNKGKDYFYNKKWKKAIKAFNEVLSDPLADENTKQQSQQFLAQAQELHKERQERREAFWSRLSEGFKNLGNSLMETSLAMQGQKTGTSSTLNTRNSSGEVRQTTNRQQTSNVNNTSNSASPTSRQKITKRYYDNFVHLTSEIYYTFEGNMCYMSDKNGNKIDFLPIFYENTTSSDGTKWYYDNRYHPAGAEHLRQYLIVSADRSSITTGGGVGATEIFQDKKMKPTAPYNYNGGVNINQNSTPYYNVSPTPSNDNKTKTCSRCYGSGFVPRGGPNYNRENDTECGASFWNSDHVCKLEQCSICKQTHCIELHHSNCSICKGTGREKVY